MKRLNNISGVFLSYENFDMAEKLSRKHKKRKDIVEFDRIYDTEEKRRGALLLVIESIKNGVFVSTAPTTTERQTGKKKRLISTVPYYPDRILHFAVYNVIRDRCKKHFINHMYSFDKGVHELTKNLSALIRSCENEKIYILKFDIKKFYDSIDYKIALKQLSRLIKDKVLLGVIEEILTVHGGVKIGMLLSTLLSSLYLSPLDRFVKESLKVKHYFRFADDFILVHSDVEFLKNVAWRIKNLLFYELGLDVNYSLVFDIDKRPLDFCGFVHRRSHVFIRKETKKRFVKTRKNKKSVASYLGMLKWCDSNHLIYKTLINNNNAGARTNTRE